MKDSRLRFEGKLANNFWGRRDRGSSRLDLMDLIDKQEIPSKKWLARLTGRWGDHYGGRLHTHGTSCCTIIPWDNI